MMLLQVTWSVDPGACATSWWPWIGARQLQRRLVVRGFHGSVIVEIPVKEVRDEMIATIEEKLSKLREAYVRCRSDSQGFSQFWINLL